MEAFLNDMSGKTDTYNVSEIKPMPQITVLLFDEFWTLGYLHDADMKFYDLNDNEINPTHWELLPEKPLNK